MPKAIIPYVPDNGEIPPIVRKAINAIRSILNPLLIRNDIVMVQEDNRWQINVEAQDDLIIALDVFSHKPQLPGLHEHQNVQQVLLTQIFTPRVSYGQVG